MKKNKSKKRLKKLKSSRKKIGGVKFWELFQRKSNDDGKIFGPSAQIDGVDVPDHVFQDDFNTKQEAVAFEKVRKNAANFETLETMYANDKSFVLKAIRLNPRVFQYVNETLRGDKEVALTALKQAKYNISYVPPSGFVDTDIVQTVMTPQMVKSLETLERVGAWQHGNGQGTITIKKNVIFEGHFAYYFKESGLVTIVQYEPITGSPSLVEIECKWKFDIQKGMDKISEIIQIKNPDHIVLSMDLISDLLQNHLTIPKEFYKLCGFIQTGEEIDLFLATIKKGDHIRLAAICHGDLVGPCSVPAGKRIHRINAQPIGVCNIGGIEKNFQLIQTCIEADPSDLIKIIKSQMILNTSQACRSLSNKDKEDKENKDFYDTCSGLTDSQEFITVGTKDGKNQIFNKEFSVQGELFNVFLVIKDSGEYINLFSLYDTLTLADTLDIIDSNRITYIDNSCSIDSEGKFTEEQKRTLGGRR